jgi:hypothetical protein
MSAIDVEIAETKWSMLVWKTRKEQPRQDEQVLIDTGEEVVAGRYICSTFVARSWQTNPRVVMWASWPKAPKW